MKTIQAAVMKGVSALAGVLILAGTASAATDGPIANLTERWNSDTSGWGREGDGTVLWTNGAVGISYGALSYPISQVTVLFATDTASNGRFLGNYIQKKITDISFDIKRAAFTGTVCLYLIANNHKWSRAITMPDGDGVWGNADISLAYDASWSLQPLEVQQSASLFTNDLTAVTKVGIIAYRTDTPMQGAFVDNFKLIGPWGQIITTGPSAGLSASWLAEYGLGAVGANGQPFNDGVTYLDKFVTGMNPNDSKAVFSVAIGKNADGHSVLRWTPQPFRTYTVLQSSDLTGGQSFSAKIAGLQSLGVNNEIAVDESGSGPHFYKVSVEQEVTQ